MARPALFTIGYEGRTVDEVVARLEAAGVTRVVDVRALPLSRRPGFSKTALGKALGRRGIDYINVRAAGNPYRALKGDLARCLALYAEYLDARPEIVSEVARAVVGRRCALLCFEANFLECHRAVLVERLTQLGPRGAKHL